MTPEFVSTTVIEPVLATSAIQMILICLNANLEQTAASDTVFSTRRHALSLRNWQAKRASQIVLLNAKLV